MRDYTVSSVVKAAEVLQFIKDNQSATFSQIQNGLGYAKSSTFQILKTLESLHFISSNQYGTYFLGYKLFELGSAYEKNASWRKIAVPYIQKASEDTGMTLHISIMAEDTVICIEKFPGRIFTMQLTAVGEPLPMHTSASAKVLLAWQPPEKQDQILDRIEYKRFTDKTIVTKEDLKLELARVKKLGYALDDQESEENCRGVARPLFACNGTILASVSMGAPIILMKQDDMLRYTEVLKTYLDEVSPLLPPATS
ncbi:IclR family transcriptional regulator [uncultured Oscillibacter sp.]|uniref:IclR family transcriptional regulator n=1 Tax=uncultured Oscillibacter sp. TaxID=876091 RepID=UPI00261BCA01|nr:IclR family transcriptional regulator [uncultured Oscillibacter sp.]